jgi:hypothetical protein
MKLWYQSMTREDARGGYPQALRRILDAVKEPARGSTRTASPTW